MSFRRTREKTVAQYTEIAADRQRSALELNALSDSIRQLRKQRGMTQAELGIAIGTEQAAIARLESGRHAPSFRTLQAIARATSAEIDLFYRLIEPTVMEKRNTMTDTLNRPGLSTDRRHFLGGAMGLAGLLGLNLTKHASAQEATAAAEAVDGYVWTPPAWEEPPLFTILGRNSETVTVETIDGQVEVPANPQRIVSLGFEYISLFELGAADRLLAVGYNKMSDPPIDRAGKSTEDMHAALANVALVPNPWELDIEHVLELEPDLIVISPFYNVDIKLLNQIAPTIRLANHATSTPRAAIRDFGALLGQDDTAAKVIAEHETFIEKARQRVAPVVEGKKAAVVWPELADFRVFPSYYIMDDAIVVNIIGAYQLHRELGITPSSFVEQLAENEGRHLHDIVISIEQVGLIDADYIFAQDPNYFDEFVSSHLVQQTVAAQNDQIYVYDYEQYGYGLAGVRAAVTAIVEYLTGEPFE
ncbi:MAG: ABC transporter substrate-binding protein [Thermomicrobiales bacterium]|nr:ABC transporter substrate-binding protein [Thermomicrobiales bacterium]